MSKTKTCMAFLFGAVAGSVGTAVVLKKVFDKALEERVASVLEVRNRLSRNSIVGDDVDDLDSDESPFPFAEEMKQMNREYRENAKNRTPIDYSAMHTKPDHGPEAPVQINGEEEMERQDRPYVIAPDEFGEHSEYDTITLICFEDGVITDRDFQIIENFEEHIGRNACAHIGDYEEDAVHVRNDMKQCDYEILKDDRLYADAISQEPRPIKL